MRINLPFKKYASIVLIMVFIFFSFGCTSNQVAEDIYNDTDQSAETSLDDSADTLEQPIEEQIVSNATPSDEDSQEVDGSDESHDLDAVGEELPSDPIVDTGVSEGIDAVDTEEGDLLYSLTDKQRNSVNILNYMAVQSQKINAARGNQFLLESIYTALSNNIYPEAVDTNTQDQIRNLLGTINNYRMIDVKRERIQFMYEQNRAQAMRKAVPNPLGLLSAVQSGDIIKAAASVLYMAIDSASSYQSAVSQADTQFLQDGWELDDAETAELHNSTLNGLNYMFDMVRKYSLPGDYALNSENVKDFIDWSNKPDTQLISKIKWFESESHAPTYEAFGPYWLELAKDYYNNKEYEKCLDAVNHYESVTTRIFKKDFDYAQVLPMAIVSAKETLSKPEYIETAARYCNLIGINTKDKDWALKYFAAQIYMDLYVLSEKTEYLDSAYKLVYDNVNNLVDEQRHMNYVYLADIEEVKPEKGATKRVKNEIKSYNKIIKEERKVALPPVSEALYLNADLLFALAEEKGISSNDKSDIEKIIHVGGEPVFLTEALDNKFWFGKGVDVSTSEDIDISFDGKSIVIPATCISERSIIQVTVSGDNATTTVDDWVVKEVKRPKNSNCSDFKITYESEIANKLKYQAGDAINIEVIPVVETPEEKIVFKYSVIDSNILFINTVKFERVQ